jgi:fibronectin type 3 domain-containing protein
MIALSGTAVAPVPHTVALSWSPSTSTVSGYNVYVSTVSGSGYTKLTGSPVPTTNFSDAGLQTAQTRYYVVTSLNASNQESAYSNEVSALVP